VHIHPLSCSIIVEMVTVGLTFVSALVGWSATAALTAYAQRRPSIAAIAWLVAAFGVTVGLSAAVIGVLFDFGEFTFRLLHIGVSLIGPLFMAWGALEFAARSPNGRFTARLFVTALTIVPLVVLSVDRISGRFGTDFPPLGLVLGLMLGIGLAEKVGLAESVIRKMVEVAPEPARPDREPAGSAAVPAGPAAPAPQRRPGLEAARPPVVSHSDRPAACAAPAVLAPGRRGSLSPASGSASDGYRSRSASRSCLRSGPARAASRQPSATRSMRPGTPSVPAAV
jgi:hypothetical protein